MCARCLPGGRCLSVSGLCSRQGEGGWTPGPRRGMPGPRRRSQRVTRPFWLATGCPYCTQVLVTCSYTHQQSLRIRGFYSRASRRGSCLSVRPFSGALYGAVIPRTVGTIQWATTIEAASGQPALTSTRFSLDTSGGRDNCRCSYRRRLILAAPSHMLSTPGASIASTSATGSPATFARAQGGGYMALRGLTRPWTTQQPNLRRLEIEGPYSRAN